MRCATARVRLNRSASQVGRSSPQHRAHHGFRASRIVESSRIVYLLPLPQPSKPSQDGCSVSRWSNFTTKHNNHTLKHHTRPHPIDSSGREYVIAQHVSAVAFVPNPRFKGLASVSGCITFLWIYSCSLDATLIIMRHAHTRSVHAF